MNVKYALAVITLSGAVLADQSSYSSGASNNYAAPSAGNYAAPSGSGAASYSAPTSQSSYGAPPASSGYGAPAQASYASTGYETSGYGYDYADDVTEGDSIKDSFALEEIIPLFLVVLLATLLAGLAAPLFTQLAMLLVGLAPGALNIKAPIINAILNPFNLVLCQTSATAAPVALTGRGFQDAWGINGQYLQLFFDAYDTILSYQV